MWCTKNSDFRLNIENVCIHSENSEQVHSLVALLKINIYHKTHSGG